MSTITVREFFEENYLKTNKIPQSFIDTYRGKVKGHQPQDVRQVVVGDLTFEYNGRRPKANDVMKYIEKEGGLNWYLFGTLDLATINNQVEDIWNALHRAIMVCICLGPDAKVPALITEFDKKSEIHGTFWKHNGGRSKNVTPEQNHVAQIKSGEPEKVNEIVHNILKKTGNTVVYVEDDIYEPISNKTEWQVMVGPLKQMLVDIKNVNVIQQGIELYQQTFSHTYNGNKPYKVVGQICQALICLLQVNHEWLSKDCKDKSNLTYFKEWLRNRAQTETDKTKWFFKEHMADRMEKKYLGTAYGIWSAFVHYFANSISRGGARPTLVKMDKALDGKIFTLDNFVKTKRKAA